MNTSIRGRSLALSMLVSFISLAARAEPSTATMYSVSAGCFEEEHRSEYHLRMVEPGDGLAAEPDVEIEECVFWDGSSSRIKINTRKPELSIWLNKARIISRAPNPSCSEDVCQVRFVVQSNRVDLCKKDEIGNETCESASASGERDPIEYPNDGDPIAPSPGSIVTTFSADDEICRLLPSWIPTFGNQYHPSGFESLDNWTGSAESISWRSKPIRGGATLDETDFDADNDGDDDTVIRLIFPGGPGYGIASPPIYFVYRQHAMSLESFEENRIIPAFARPSYEMGLYEAAVLVNLSAQAKSVWPPQLESDRPHDIVSWVQKYYVATMELEHATPPWWNTVEQPRFPLLSVEVSPIRRAGTTYMWVHPRESSWYVLFRPSASGRASETCVFHIAGAHY